MLDIADVSDSMQNLILQHSSINIFLKHYLDRRINADLLKIHHGMKPEKELMSFACLMSRSIDPRRPRKLTPEQFALVEYLLCIVKLASVQTDSRGLQKAVRERRSIRKLVDALETRSSSSHADLYNCNTSFLCPKISQVFCTDSRRTSLVALLEFAASSLSFSCCRLLVKFSFPECGSLPSPGILQNESCYNPLFVRITRRNSSRP